MTNISEIPDSAWITKSLERDVVKGGARGWEHAYPTRTRIVGALQGEYPHLGHVRRIPSIDHDVRVTDVNAFIRDDGTLDPVDTPDAGRP